MARNRCHILTLHTYANFWTDGFEAATQVRSLTRNSETS
jgi:hypothetical protein